MKRSLVVLAALAMLVTVGSAAARSVATPYGHVFETTIKSGPSALKGKWLISFAPNGAYAVAKEPSTSLLIGGVSGVSGHSILFADATGPLHCTGSQTRGAYSWSLSGSTLTLKATTDTCPGRKLILSSSSFVKVR